MKPSASALGRFVLEQFAEAAQLGHTAARQSILAEFEGSARIIRTNRYSWPLWRAEHEAPTFRAGEAVRPAARACEVCARPCDDWRAKTCSAACAHERSRARRRAA